MFLSVVILISIPLVYATHDDTVRLINIQIGSGCTLCPELEVLIPYDTSKASVSGGFNNDTGTWVREKPVFQNHWQTYQFDYGKNIVFVGMYPDLQWKSHQKTIILSDYIQSKKFGSIQQGVINSTSHIIQYWNATINRNLSGCSTATIDSHDWKNLLNDTLTYFHHECNPEFTNIETIKKVIISNKTKTTGVSLKDWLEPKFQTLGDWCKDKHPCVYQYEGPAWIWTVVEWYKADLVSHEELQQMLAWCMYRVTDVLPIYK